MTLSIEFGALSEPIAEQLKKQGISIPQERSDILEKIAYSLVFLHLHGIITDSARDNSCRKLIKKIVASIKETGVKLE